MLDEGGGGVPAYDKTESPMVALVSSEYGGIVAVYDNATTHAMGLHTSETGGLVVIGGSARYVAGSLPQVQTNRRQSELPVFLPLKYERKEAFLASIVL